MSSLTDIDTLDQRLRGLGQYIINNITDASINSASQYWNPATGNWMFTIANYRDDANAGAIALQATMWALTIPRNPVWYDRIIKSMSAHMSNQSTTTKPGFWDNNAGAPAETFTGHNLVNMTITYDVMKPYLPAAIASAWLATIKNAVDQLWATDGNGGVSGLWWVNGNYNCTFEYATRWYYLRTGNATYLTQANYFWDFLLNGTTSTTVSSSIPGWSTSYSGGNGGNASFVGFGCKFTTPPTTNDWSDGVGWLVENGGGLGPGNLPGTTYGTASNSFDPEYSELTINCVLTMWLLTGDIRYKRLVNVIHNALLPRHNLTSTAVIRRPDNTTGPVYTVTNVDSGTGGVVRITIGAGHSIPTGVAVTVSGVVGVTAANTTKNSQNVTATTFELASTTFSGTYTSGGSAQEGNSISPWNSNGYGGSRHNVQFASDGAELAATTWFSSANHSSLLIPQLTNSLPGTNGADGKIESTFRAAAINGGNQIFYRALGINVSTQILYTNLARSTFRRDRNI